MTALADQLAADGYFMTTAIADLAITAGQVHRDGNSQVRVAGRSAAIVADQLSGAATQVAALPLRDQMTPSIARGTGANKW